MKKLEDIPKKNIFEVPEGYFDRLPGVIQSRVAESKPEPAWSPYLRFSLRYALPVLVAGFAAFLFLRTPEVLTPQEALATVDSNDLIAYLEEGDITTDDLLDGVYLDEADADAIQLNSFSEMNLEGVDVDRLSEELGVDYF